MYAGDAANRQQNQLCTGAGNFEPRALWRPVHHLRGWLPYGVPLCFVLSGNSIYFHCAVEGQKLDNLAHDSRVCLTAVIAAENCPARFTMRYRSAMAFGTARIVYGEDERLAALRLLTEKYAPEQGDEGAAAYIKAHIQDTLVVRMEVEYISGKDNYPKTERA